MSRDRVDKLFIWGLGLVALGWMSFPVGMRFANEPRLHEEMFSWALRVGVLAHLVGAALVLASGRSLWLRISLAVFSFTGALLWFLSAFSMM